MMTDTERNDWIKSAQAKMLMQAAEIERLKAELAKANEHMNDLCMCPTHGGVSFQIPEGEFDG